MRVVERPFSEFLRQPKDVVAELVEHDVVLRRRNAPSLRLSQADRDEERSEAFDTLAQLLRTLAAHNPSALDPVLDDVFAWLTFLPEPDRRSFVEEFTTTLVGSAAIDNYLPVAQVLREWKATAELHADPNLQQRLAAPVTADGEPVPAPAG